MALYKGSEKLTSPFLNADQGRARAASACLIYVKTLLIPSTTPVQKYATYICQCHISVPFLRQLYQSAATQTGHVARYCPMGLSIAHWCKTTLRHVRRRSKHEWMRYKMIKSCPQSSSRPWKRSPGITSRSWSSYCNCISSTTVFHELIYRWAFCGLWIKVSTAHSVLATWRNLHQKGLKKPYKDCTGMPFQARFQSKCPTFLSRIPPAQIAYSSAAAIPPFPRIKPQCSGTT